MPDIIDGTHYTYCQCHAGQYFHSACIDPSGHGCTQTWEIERQTLYLCLAEGAKKAVCLHAKTREKLCMLCCFQRFIGRVAQLSYTMFRRRVQHLFKTVQAADTNTLDPSYSRLQAISPRKIKAALTPCRQLHMHRQRQPICPWPRMNNQKHDTSTRLYAGAKMFMETGSPSK